MYIWNVWPLRMTDMCLKVYRCHFLYARGYWLTATAATVVVVVAAAAAGIVVTYFPLHWRHNDHDSVSNHQPHGCLLNRLFRRRSKKTSKLRVTGLCAGNSPGPMNSPHKGPVTRKQFPFDDVIMKVISGHQWLRKWIGVRSAPIH